MILSSDTITVTTTAMPRPELLAQTYESFQAGLPWLDFSTMTLILNVDSFPCGGDCADKVQETIRVASSYFGTVKSRATGAGSFPLAVKWVWSQVDTPWILNLEDDWKLLRVVNREEIEPLFNDKVRQVCLRAYPWPPSRRQVSLSPSFLCAQKAKEYAQGLTGLANPEVQVRAMKLTEACYFPVNENEIILEDLGRPWIDTTKYVRPGGGFTKWRRLGI